MSVLLIYTIFGLLLLVDIRVAQDLTTENYPDYSDYPDTPTPDDFPPDIDVTDEPTLPDEYTDYPDEPTTEASPPGEEPTTEASAPGIVTDYPDEPTTDALLPDEVTDYPDEPTTEISVPDEVTDYPDESTTEGVPITDYPDEETTRSPTNPDTNGGDPYGGSGNNVPSPGFPGSDLPKLSQLTLVTTSGSPQSCKDHSDCYKFEAPPEWMCGYIENKHKWTLWSCYCAKGSCIHERVNKGVREYTYCIPESQRKC